MHTNCYDHRVLFVECAKPPNWYLEILHSFVLILIILMLFLIIMLIQKT